MTKAPDAFRTISEVADWLGVQTHVLRFWESKFRQIKPVKRAGGRRYYRPSDMTLLGGIKKLLHEDGMTIKGAQKVLKDQGVQAVSAMSRPLDQAPVGEPVTEKPSKVVQLKPASEPAAQIEMFAEPELTEPPQMAEHPEVLDDDRDEASEVAETPVEHDPVAVDDGADADLPDAVSEPTLEPEPTPVAAAMEEPAPVAMPLPSADTPVLEALRQLQPGQVPAIQLQAIYDQMVLLRSRMDGAAASG